MTRTDRLSTVPSWEKAKAQIQEKLNGNLPERESLEKFRQQDWWYTDGQQPDHGPLHQARVLVLVNLGLIVLTKRTDVNFPQTIREASSWMAVTHDTQIEPGTALAHGRDAATWVGKNLKGQVDPETLRLTQYYCINHALPDERVVGQEYVDGLDPLLVDTGLKLTKDADAVDRARFHFLHLGSLNESRLRLPLSKEILLPTAKELFRLTGEKSIPCDQAFDLVFTAAVDMGIVK